MGQVQHAFVVYGWNRIQRQILEAALLNHGWRLVDPQTDTQKTTHADILLVYSQGCIADLQIIRRARATHPNTGIVLLGNEITDPELLEFIEAGVGAYIGAHQGFQELLDAMQMVLEKRSPPSGRITRLVVENIKRATQQNGLQANGLLTFREKEVLRLIERGLSNKEIADYLRIAPNTVKNHVHNLLEKLNVKSRHEAAWANSCL